MVVISEFVERERERERRERERRSTQVLMDMI
jgi:hypothetical protein